MTVGFSNQVRRLVVASYWLNSEEHNPDAKILCGDHALTYILVAGDKVGGRHGAFASESHQVAIYERINALLPSETNTTETELDVLECADGEVI